MQFKNLMFRLSVDKHHRITNIEKFIQPLRGLRISTMNRNNNIYRQLNKINS